MAENPYRGLPHTAFWAKAVAGRHYEDIERLWEPLSLDGSELFATAGSCFAQHLGRHVRTRSAANYLDLEPAPALIPPEEHSRFGYGIYSCRYGNIYTARQLLQLAEEATGARPVSTHVWERSGRYFDALRPTVDPVGLADPDTVVSMRKEHLARVKEMLSRVDVMIFTLGLTEAWVSPDDGTVFPTAPGVVAGTVGHDRAEFQNYRVSDVREDMLAFWRVLKQVNPDARMILTVSPVPLIATASGHHVLPATMYSKSALRAAAHELSEIESDITYFPSYEVINSAQGRGYYFEPDLRSVNDRGVRHVMEHFFTGDLGLHFPEPNAVDAGGDVVCDEEAIERAEASAVDR